MHLKQRLKKCIDKYLSIRQISPFIEAPNSKVHTSVFGVNDKVYTLHINTLKNIREEAIKSAKPQTKIILATMFSFNDTEVRIERKL